VKSLLKAMLKDNHLLTDLELICLNMFTRDYKYRSHEKKINNTLTNKVSKLDGIGKVSREIVITLLYNKEMITEKIVQNLLNSQTENKELERKLNLCSENCISLKDVANMLSEQIKCFNDTEMDFDYRSIFTNLE